MDRRKFYKSCCYICIGAPIVAMGLQSCGSIYYAAATPIKNSLAVLKSEFWYTKKEKEIPRQFVLIKAQGVQFPICLFKNGEDDYDASLLRCTHRGCELNVGGGIFSCPCHGSEFTTKGEVIEGPADRNLTTYKTWTDDEKIYIQLS